MCADGSPLQEQDWGSKDFAHTDWDYEDPGTKGIKKGGMLTLEVVVKCCAYTPGQEWLCVVN